MKPDPSIELLDLSSDMSVTLGICEILPFALEIVTIGLCYTEKCVRIYLDI
jgi:hypothetical protein